MITHRAFWDESVICAAQLTEAPIGCPCRECRVPREQGWEGGEGDCLLSAEWETDYDPHKGLTATRYSESKQNCEGQARITLDTAGCAARWGARFIAALEARMEHNYWYSAWCDGREAPSSDFETDHKGPSNIDNSAEVKAATENADYQARRAARRGQFLDTVKVGVG